MGEREVSRMLSLNIRCEESETVNRLIQRNVKRGSGCRSKLKGEARYRFNQMAIGNISSVTLAWLLKRRTEHVWTCPQCSDVGLGNK